jgi:hypothetical protein
MYAQVSSYDIFVCFTILSSVGVAEIDDHESFLMVNTVQSFETMC